MSVNKKVIVFDIDGTLANIEHRKHHVQNGSKNWKAFNAEMANDSPNQDIMWLADIFGARRDCIVVIASGRGEEDRVQTEAWLDRFEIHHAKLYMRPAKDSRKDSIIKREILDQIRAEFGEPFMVFDDRNQVVDMWRENGIRCLQVAPGNF